MKYKFLQEDLLFFQLFYSINQSDKKAEDILKLSNQENPIITNNNQIIFDIKYQDVKLKDVNLIQTVNNETLVYEKIAPGTSGNFKIIIKSKEDINYQIFFESKNEKPTNLQFYTLENNKRFSSLEELGKNLKGKVSKEQKKTIQVFWEWCYETNQINNKQDTIDAEKIRQYNFSIYVKGNY